MLFNYHTHTKRCNHATGEEREYIETAIQGGLKSLGFSDHAPYIFPDGHQSFFRMKQDQLHEYAETVRALAKEYEKDIRVTGLPDDVHVTTTVVVEKINRLFGAAEFVRTQKKAFCREFGWAVDLFGELAFNAGGRNGGLLWQVKNRGELYAV